MKPSLIFNRTQTPRNIKVNSPKLEININSLTKKPNSKPIPPANWKKPVIFLKLFKPYLLNSYLK